MRGVTDYLSQHFKPLNIGRYACTLFVTMAMLLVMATVSATEPSANREFVRSELSGFFSDYLGRTLTPAEADAATQAFLGYFDDKTSCTQACMTALQSRRSEREIFVSARGEPKDLMLRQVLITRTYFHPEHQAPVLLKLLTERDPIVMADWNSKRLMTQADIAALANFVTLLETGGPPHVYHLTEPGRAEIIANLQQRYGGETGHTLPIGLCIAAELWAGVQRDWTALSSEQREQVFTYLRAGPQAPMPAQLYARLLDLSLHEGQQIANIDHDDGHQQDMAYMMRVQRAIAGIKAVEGIQGALFPGQR